ncbi:MAG: hypothetical protein JXN62_01305 [Bacteroidales bacterium]|nr:hypothetical protein [Bacteroidales bacterium]
MFKDGFPNIESYLPVKLAAKIAPRLNDQRLKEVLDDKLYFYLFFKQFNIDTPKVLMYNHGISFVRDGKTFKVANGSDFAKQLKELFDQNQSSDSVIVKKIYASSKGCDIYKISSDQIESDPEQLNFIYENIVRSEFLFQETVKQHSVLNNLNPSSVNTIRIDTLLGSDGKISVLSGYIRMSINDHFVDNIGSGGCMVGVDMESGRLHKYAKTDFNHNPTKLYTFHPITKTVFEGFQLPMINEAKEMVERAAALIPGLRIVGWDVAIGENGPVIIEGNSDYGIRGNDLAYGGYLAHPELKKVLHEDLGLH